MIVLQNKTCSFCHKEFQAIVPYSEFRCDECGKPYTICPECAEQQQHCSCGGAIISNDEYIHRYGIDDIYGEHFDVKGPLFY